MTVFRAGDAHDHIFILLDGAIDMKCVGKMIESIGPGCSLGIVGVLDNKPRAATALVRQVAELTLIDRKNFRFMVEAVPHFVWYVMAELVDRLRATNAALSA